MAKIITDSSVLYTVEQGKERGFDITPLQVTIAGKTYREFEEITADKFLELIAEGHIPSSSQPKIGEVMDLFEKYDGEEILVLSMADGLSGTYQSCAGIAANTKHPEKIHVFNTRTLCGPHQHVVDIASEMNKQGKSIDEILEVVNEKLKITKSFLMPQDYDYLKRGGRLTRLSATLGGLLHLQPVLIETEDGKRLDKFAVARSFDIAIKKIIDEYKKDGIGEGHIVYITHAKADNQVGKIKEKLLNELPGIEVKVLELSCGFITQGGPRCIAIQSVSK